MTDDERLDQRAAEIRAAYDKELRRLLDAKDREIAERKREIADVSDDYLRRHKDACDRLEEIIALKAERDAARAQVDKLKTALRQIDEAVCSWGGPYDADPGQINDIARAALDGETP